MQIKCPKCGGEWPDSARFCGFCGTRLRTPQSGEMNSAKLQANQMASPQYSSPAPNVKIQRKKHGFLKALLCLAVTTGVLALLWFAVGNWITLYFHSNDVVETLNSGSMELAGLESAYSTLPNFVQDMLAMEQTEENPVIEANLPYIRASRKKIYGFFGAASVEYVIYAPNVEDYLLELDMSTINSSEQLLELVVSNIPNLPLKEHCVAVEYYKDGLFSWRGNYLTTAFSNAVSGGLNSAYNQFYFEMMKAFEEALE